MNRNERWAGKRKKKNEWQGKEFSGVIFYPHLKEKNAASWRVIQRGKGQVLIRKKPFEGSNCIKEKCFPCDSKEKKDKIGCRKMGVVMLWNAKYVERKIKQHVTLGKQEKVGQFNRGQKHLDEDEDDKDENDDDEGNDGNKDKN